jgi:hypothetical protein
MTIDSRVEIRNAVLAIDHQFQTFRGTESGTEIFDVKSAVSSFSF